jgi:hypothetical protein
MQNTSLNSSDVGGRSRRKGCHKKGKLLQFSVHLLANSKYLYGEEKCRIQYFPFRDK